MTPNMIAAVETYLMNELAARIPDVPVFFSGMAVPANVSDHIRVWVLASDDTTPVSIGETAGSRNVGLVQVDFFGPKDIGAGNTGDKAFVAQKLLHRRPLEVAADAAWVIFREASTRDMGPTNEQHWHRVRVPYRYDVPNSALSG